MHHIDLALVGDLTTGGRHILCAIELATALLYVVLGEEALAVSHHRARARVQHSPNNPSLRVLGWRHGELLHVRTDILLEHVDVLRVLLIKFLDEEIDFGALRLRGAGGAAGGAQTGQIVSTG